ncbi:MAG: carbon-nitrogen hydrolase family protein [Sulfitobacter sp.]
MISPRRYENYIAAAVQAAPIFLDLDATIDKAILLINEAAREGAKLVAFPESWVSSYPVWIFGAAAWGDRAAARAYAQLHASALMIGAEPLNRLCAAAHDAGVMVVMGANEKLSRDAGTIYNSQFFISETGALLGVHRKIMPTYTERNVWGYGDGSTLSVFDQPQGRVGGLICWEHWMPLTRFAMHSQNEHVHIAAWPDVSKSHQLASQHYAFEGRCYVICVGSYQCMRDIPEDFELFDAIAAIGELGGSAEEILPGNSGIIGPDGEWISGPIAGKEAIIYGEIDLQRCVEEKLLLDTTGHYNRPDIFQLNIDKRPRPEVVLQNDQMAKTES